MKKKTQIVTKLDNSNYDKQKNSNCEKKLKKSNCAKNSSCDETRIMLKFNNCDETQKEKKNQKLKIWKKSNFDKTQKLKLWQNSNFDKTEKDFLSEFFSFFLGLKLFSFVRI